MRSRVGDLNEHARVRKPGAASDFVRSLTQSIASSRAYPNPSIILAVLKGDYFKLDGHLDSFRERSIKVRKKVELGDAAHIERKHFGRHEPAGSRQRSRTKASHHTSFHTKSIGELAVLSRGQAHKQVTEKGSVAREDVPSTCRIVTG
jgi:hypothetical protein